MNTHEAEDANNPLRKQNMYWQEFDATLRSMAGLAAVVVAICGAAATLIRPIA